MLSLLAEKILLKPIKRSSNHYVRTLFVCISARFAAEL